MSAIAPAPYPPIATAILCGLAVLLIAAMIGDIRHRRIPNRLCATIALLALPYWLAAAVHPFAQIGLQLLLLLVATLPLILLFAGRLFGGGDIKLLGALLLWVQPGDLPVMIVVTAGTGAILGVVLLGQAKLRRRPTPSVPYGVAIAIGAALALAAPLRALLAQGGF